MNDSHLPKIELQPRGCCPTCEKVLTDIFYNRQTWKWQRAPKRKYCSLACSRESLSKGGDTWLRRFAPRRTLEVLGLLPGDS